MPGELAETRDGCWQPSNTYDILKNWMGCSVHGELHSSVIVLGAASGRTRRDKDVLSIAQPASSVAWKVRQGRPPKNPKLHFDSDVFCPLFHLSPHQDVGALIPELQCMESAQFILEVVCFSCFISPA